MSAFGGIVGQKTSMFTNVFIYAIIKRTCIPNVANLKNINPKRHASISGHI
jgi:hypothetical protein